MTKVVDGGFIMADGGGTVTGGLGRPYETVTFSVAEPRKIPYKYSEGRIINDLRDYIDNTYGQHYKTEDQSVECFDAWIALGDSMPTFRNTALKYLWRYGKKHGNNKDDLLKALHYIILCLHVDHYKDSK
jgi:hypothetical protein